MCSQQNLVRFELSGLRLELALLDCEHSYDQDDLEALIHYVTEQHNYHMLPASSLLLTLAHLLDYLILLPYTSSCGLLVRVLPTGTQPTEVCFFN
jgi:hypothetical protein